MKRKVAALCLAMTMVMGCGISSSMALGRTVALPTKTEMGVNIIKIEKDLNRGSLEEDLEGQYVKEVRERLGEVMKEQFPKLFGK